MTSDDPPRLRDLNDIVRHDVGDAVHRGAAVRDPQLAPAAIELAQFMKRVAMLLTVGLTVAGLVAGLVVAAMLDQPLVQGAAIGAVGIAPISVGMGAWTHGMARRAQQRNARLLPKSRSSGPT